MKRFPSYPKPTDPCEIMRFMFDHEVRLVTVYGKKEPGVVREEAIIFGQGEIHVSFAYKEKHNFTDIWNEFYLPGMMYAWNHLYGQCTHGKVPFDCPTCNPPKNRVEANVTEGTPIIP